jgi:hypothetical protein
MEEVTEALMELTEKELTLYYYGQQMFDKGAKTKALILQSYARTGQVHREVEEKASIDMNHGKEILRILGFVIMLENVGDESGTVTTI